MEKYAEKVDKNLGKIRLDGLFGRLSILATFVYQKSETLLAGELKMPRMKRGILINYFHEQLKCEIYKTKASPPFD